MCSSLVRARRTAEIIGEALALEVVPNDAWQEFDNGPLAGLPHAEAARRYPKPAFRDRFERFTADGGESYAAFSRRISGALEGSRAHGFGESCMPEVWRLLQLIA